MIGIISSIGGGLVAISLAYLDYGVWALAVKYVLSTLITTMALWVMNPWRPTHFIVPESFKRLFGFGSKLFVSGLLNTVFNNIYKVVIGKVFSASILGYYTQAQLYVKQVTQGAVGTLQKVTYPILSKTKGDEQRLKQAYRKIILASSFVIFPATIGLALVAEPMILTLVGEKWLPAAPFLQLLCVSGALHHLHSINLNVLKVVGRSDLFLKLEIIKKVNITVAIIIGLQFGIWGLLIAKVISSYIALYINMYYTKSFIDYPQLEQFKDLVPVILHTLPMAGIVFLIIQFVELPQYLILTTGILLGAVTYMATTILFKSEALKHIQTLLGHRMPILNRIKL
jgi:O-antigen/teichoic acid export membrane protein